MKVSNSRLLGIIPARGGSKGLPGKNLKEIFGKPLIQWSIEFAKNLDIIDKFIVSTDDKKIADLSLLLGAKVPFMRPNFLAEDTSESIDVLLHAIDFFESQNKFFDYIIMIEPTSPIRDWSFTEAAFHKLVESDATSIVSVGIHESTHSKFSVTLDSEGYIKNDKLSNLVSGSLRRQDLSDEYFFDGTFYISSVESLKENKGFYHSKTLGFPVPRYMNFEVDDIFDFVIIESLMQHLGVKFEKK